MLRVKLPADEFATRRLVHDRVPFVPAASRCLRLLSSPWSPSGGAAVFGVGDSLRYISFEILPAADQQQLDDDTSEGATTAAPPAAPTLRVCNASWGLPLSGRIMSLDIWSPARVVVATDDGRLTFATPGVMAPVMQPEQVAGARRPRDTEDEGDAREQQRWNESQQVVLVQNSIGSAAPAPDSNASSTLLAATPGSSYIGVDAFPRGGVIAVTSELQRSIRIVDVTTATCIRDGRVSGAVPCDGFPIASCRFSGDDDGGGAATTPLLAVSTGQTISIFDLRTRLVPQQRSAVLGGESSATCLCAMPPGRGEHFLLSGNANRNVCLWDVRKFTKQHVSQNALKYAPGSVAVAGGEGETLAVAAGVDSEVRPLVLSVPGQSGGASAASAAANAKTSAASVAGGGAAAAAAPTASAMQVGGTFRQRLQGATHCATTWHGSWTGKASLDMAAGISSDLELFVMKC